jgi:serine/threonine protein kinase
MTGAPPIPPDAPRVADGRYALLTRLGEGGMAVVYGAWDEDLRIWRAVKVLLPEFARRKSVRRRFEREARTMMSIRHENLVRVIEVDARRALPYLVMDLIPGGSLEDWGLRHGPMPPRLATDVAVQVCQGLCAVHSAGVVHRDVKPQNVLVDPAGVCKLTDFGVARVAGGDTKTGVAVGTIGFMAPEQLADAKSVDVRSDLFSLGAMLYVLVTRAPVRDLFRVVEDPAALAVLPPALQPIVGRCLQYEREDRPPDAQTVLDELLSARAELPAPPEDTPALARTPADAAPGVPAQSFTELLGMLDTVLPPDPDTPEESWSPPVLSPPASASSLAQTVVHPTPAAPARRHRPLIRSLGLAMVGGLVVGAGTAGIGALLGSLAIGYGGARVDAAAARYDRSLGVVQSRMADSARLSRDLALVGVAMQAKPPPDTLQFAEQLARQVRPVLEQHLDGEPEQARQRLQLVIWALDDLHEARAEWANAAEGPLGQLAVQMGAARTPELPPPELPAPAPPSPEGPETQ